MNKSFLVGFFFVKFFPLGIFLETELFIAKKKLKVNEKETGVI